MKKSKICAILMVVLVAATLLAAFPMTASAAEATQSATKISSMEELVSGQYVVVVNSGKSMGLYENNWVLPQDVTVTDNTISDLTGVYTWTLTVNKETADVYVTLTDANGVTVKPKGGNNNGIVTGTYEWKVEFSSNDGTFRFLGTGSDTVILASNTTKTSGENRFRGYKSTTVSGDAKTYPSYMSLYKVNGNVTTEIEYVSIADARAAAEDATVYTEGTVIFKSGSELAIYDPQANIGIRLVSSDDISGISVGDKIKVVGTRDTYYSQVRLKDVTIKETSADGDDYSHKLVTIADLIADTEFAYESTPVRLENVKVTDIESNGSVVISDGTNTVKIFKAPALDGIEEGNIINVNNAIAERYNDNTRILIASASDVELVAECICIVDQALAEFTEYDEQAATCMVEGKKAYKVCNDCGAKYYADGTPVENDDDLVIPTTEGEHVIVLDETKWSYGSDHHWKACACGEKFEYAEHDDLYCTICDFYKTGVYYDETKDGYYFLEYTGKLLTGKFYVTQNASNGLVEAGWYYADESGKFYNKEVVEIDGKLYYFENGQGANGIHLVDGSYYCSLWTGEVRTGKIYVTADSINGLEGFKSGWYYTDDNGAFYDKAFVEIAEEDATYYFEKGQGISNGVHLITVEEVEKFFCFDHRGRLRTGRFYITVASTNGIEGFNGWHTTDESGAIID